MQTKNHRAPGAHERGGGVHRILIVGGGFGGVHVARQLERRFRHQPNVEITLLSRDNFFLITPLLFEACSGTLELRHCSVPIRACLRRAKFVQGTVRKPIDLERRIVLADGEGSERELRYDQLVLALGAWTNLGSIPGSKHALTFKTMADAILLRNHVIERFEAADVEPDPELKRRLLTFVVVGGGLVGTELLGELSAFADDIVGFYPSVKRHELRFFLFDRSPRIMPEIEPGLVDYAVRVLQRRPGVVLRMGESVKAIEPDAVLLDGERVTAGTIVLAAGTVPSPIVAALRLEKSKRGHVMTDATLRSSRPEVWALGDCARIPGPHGKPYPYLAQHALREAKVLAFNICAAYRGRPLVPFKYEMLGVMAALGKRQGVARVLSLRLRGFIAWWLRRTYYLLQTPGLERKLRIVADWTLALFLRPDVVKVDIADERALVSRDAAPAAAVLTSTAPPRGSLDGFSPLSGDRFT
jgi:NADH dehydrogenase